MPMVLLVVALFALVMTTLGGAPVTSAARAAAADDGFTVMTFNIQHGMNARGRYELQQAIDLIARVSPDVAGLQETVRNHPKYECDDQPKRLAEGLTRATGQQWQSVYQQEWFTPDVSCKDRGTGDGKETEGLTVLSPHPIDKVAHTDLWNTRIGLAVRVGGFGRIPIVVSHLASGTKGAEDRHKQVGPLLAWAEGLGTPRVMMGDFNMAADADELQPVLKNYRDAWRDASASSRARGVASGSTRVGKEGRIDYVFFTDNPKLTLDWVETVDSAKLVGQAVSDHQPVLAHFTVH